MNRPDVSAVLGSSVIGALVGTVVVFLNRPQMPPIVKGPGGVELTHPVYVGKVSLWVYAAVAVGCALAAACLALIALRMAKQARH
jgi:hypothetical protein